MTENPKDHRTPEERTTDKVKETIATHLYETGSAAVRPIVGGFVILAEYSDESGDPSVVAIRNGELAIWTEIGLLESRLITLKAQWETTMKGNDT